MAIFDDLLVRAGLTALGTALAAGLLGFFLTSKRSVVLNETALHSVVLGIALAIAFAMSFAAGAFLFFLMVALCFYAWRTSNGGGEALFATLAHGGLALGLLSFAVFRGTKVDLDYYILGDILEADKADLGIIWSVAIVVLLAMGRLWKPLIVNTSVPKLAFSTGQKTELEAIVFKVLIALVVASAIKVTGALLLAALFILPPLAAHRLAPTALGVAALSMGIGGICVSFGLQVALYLGTPISPTIVISLVLVYAIGAFSSVFTRIGG